MSNCLRLESHCRDNRETNHVKVLCDFIWLLFKKNMFILLNICKNILSTNISLNIYRLNINYDYLFGWPNDCVNFVNNVMICETVLSICILFINQSKQRALYSNVGILLLSPNKIQIMVIEYVTKIFM